MFTTIGAVLNLLLIMASEVRLDAVGPACVCLGTRMCMCLSRKEGDRWATIILGQVLA
jgi:hypothetical protein